MSDSLTSCEVNSEVLSPCPFCGGEAHLSVDPEGTRDINGRLWAYTVVCERCAATSGLTFSGQMAADEWNRRAERTCRIGMDVEKVETDLGMIEVREYWCSECYGRMMADDDYCPSCGAKVVEG